MCRFRWLHWSVGTLVVIAALAGAVAPIGTVAAQPAPPPASPVSKVTGTWQLISSPNAGSTTTNNILEGVTTLSASDAWAVGYDWATNPYQMNETLAEHWNGTNWTIETTQNPGTDSDQFNAVAAISSDDVWAVGGDKFANVGVGQPLIENWNGSSWSVVNAPNPSQYFAMLTAVAAVATNDVWAAGYYAPANGSAYSNTLIEHWDGSQWTVVPSPNVNTNSELTSMTVISSTDIWAIGWSTFNGSTSPYTPLFLHWDGSSWSDTSASGAIASAYGIWQGVASTSSSDVWAVGSLYQSSPTSTFLSRVAHWDGTSWSLMPTINSPAELYGATKIGAFGVMTVGEMYTSSFNASEPLADYEGGTVWTAMIGPTVNTYTNPLMAVAAIPGTRSVWAVGTYASGVTGAFQKTLIEYFGTTAPSTSNGSPAPYARGSSVGMSGTGKIGVGSNEAVAGVHRYIPAHVW